MILGFLFPIGGGFNDLAKTGQDRRFIDLDLKAYSQYFKKLLIFSYLNEKRRSYDNCRLVSNKRNIHRYIYSIILPFINKVEFKNISILRCSHLTATIPAIISKLLYKTPFVFNYAYDYKYFLKIEKRYFLVFLIHLWEYLALRLANGIIASTPEITDKLNSLKLKNIKYIPNGVDLNIFKPNNKIKKNHFEILYVGRLEKQKNLMNLILAVSKLKQKRKYILHFVGDGSLKYQLIQMAKKHKVNLKVSSFVPNDQLPQFYNRAEVFSLVSLTEGFPKVMLEAQACGLPVLVSATFGKSIIKEGKTGILCKTGSSDIASKLELLFSNRDLRYKLAKKARLDVSKNYSIQKLLKVEIDFLKSLV